MGTRGTTRGEYTANNLLERREVDAAVLIGTEGIDKLSRDAQSFLQNIPIIALDYPSVEIPIPAAVQFTTAVYGIHRPGTAYRMDEVPIPLRTVLDSPLPADHEVLAGITRIVQAKCVGLSKPLGGPAVGKTPSSINNAP